MEYQEYRSRGLHRIEHATQGAGYWAVAGESLDRRSVMECIAQHEGADISLVRVGVVRFDLFPTAGQPPFVTFPDLELPRARAGELFWVETIVPRGELDLFRLRGRLAGLETTLYRGTICEGHIGPVTLMLAKMSMRFDLSILDIEKRLTDPEIDGGHYDLPEVTHAREIKAKLEGLAGAVEAPGFLGQIKHRVQSTGEGARDLARALVRFGMQAPANVNRELITLVYQYVEALREHQEAGHRPELTGAECADFIGENWDLGDRGFRKMLAERPAPTSTVAPESTASEHYPGLETSSVRLPDGSTLRVIHDGTIAMLFRETDRDHAEPIATGDLASIASRATALAEQACPPPALPKKHASTNSTAIGSLRQMVADKIARGV